MSHVPQAPEKPLSRAGVKGRNYNSGFVICDMSRRPMRILSTWEFKKKSGSQTKRKQEWSCVPTEFGDRAISPTLSPFQPFRNPPLVCEFYTEETALQTKVPKVGVFILL